MSTLDDLSKTKIYQELKLKSSQSVDGLLWKVSKVISDCDKLLSRISDTFPEYTLHDSTHSLNIVKIMDKLIPEEIIKSLNSVELSLLILAAYLHDIGMLLTKDEIEPILSSKDFQDFQQGYPEILDTLERSIRVPEHHRVATELENFLISEFVRKIHGKRSREYIISHNGNELKYKDINFAEDLALIAESHTIEAPKLLTQNERRVDIYRTDKMIGDQKVNIRFLAICLRLADIMDFDRERTPLVLYQHILPENNVSVIEWNKHLSVNGWSVNKDYLRYECKCYHPVYQRAIYSFMDQIEAELNSSYNVFQRDRSINYDLNIPRIVERNFIESVGYIYGDFQFSLDTPSIMNLLMGDKLYSSYEVAIRELLQNAIDACRCRQSLEVANDLKKSEAEIILSLHEENGHKIFEIEDNGIGMNEDIIQNYLMKVGKSYYRSADFERLRIDFRKKDVDFEPISQFGIGVLTCFMIASKFRIETYRFDRIEKESIEPLEVNIEGISDFYVVRKGQKEKFGTKLTLFLKMNKELDLVKIVKNFLNHPEFRIIIDDKTRHLRTEVYDTGYQIFNLMENIKKLDYSIKLGLSHFDPLEEHLKIINIDLSQNLKYKSIRGQISLLFPKDKDGKMCASNEVLVLFGNHLYLNIIRKTIAIEILDEILVIDLKFDFLKQFSLMMGDKQNIELHNDIMTQEFWTLAQFVSFCNYLEFYITKKYDENEDYEKTDKTTNSKPIENFYSASRTIHEIHLNAVSTHMRNMLNTLRISLPTSKLSCDGINIPTQDFLKLFSIPFSFDIDLKNEEKLNLNVTRDRVIKDRKLKKFRRKISEIISDEIFAKINDGEATDNLGKRYELFRYFERHNYILDYLFKRKEFRNNMYLVKVRSPTGVFISTISNLKNIIEQYKGTLQVISDLSINHDKKDSIKNPHPIKSDVQENSHSYIVLNYNLLSKLSAYNVVTLYKSKNDDGSFAIIDFERENPIQIKSSELVFTKYEDTVKDFLYVQNPLKGFNFEHPLVRIYGEVLHRYDHHSTNISNSILEILRIIRNGKGKNEIYSLTAEKLSYLQSKLEEARFIDDNLKRIDEHTLFYDSK